MAVLVNEASRVMIQGITGATGRKFAARMLTEGTALVAGVTPGRSGSDVAGVQVFESVAEAVHSKHVNVSLITVPPPAVLDAVAEAATAGVEIISVYTEGVPVHDSLRAREICRLFGSRLIGPNAAGVVSPGRCNISDLDGTHLRSGRLGIISKSGTLSYEVVDQLMLADMGFTTVACLGGDPISGTTCAEMITDFINDDETEGIVLLGEIGGIVEVEAARVWAKMGRQKPLVAHIAGQAAPAGKRIGHAGAILEGEETSAQKKLEALANYGVEACWSLTEIAQRVWALMGSDHVGSGPVEPSIATANRGGRTT